MSREEETSQDYRCCCQAYTSSEFNSRSQVDLVDTQSSPQGQFKWIIVYQCHLTKFVILRPLSSKRAAEVASQLLDIFLIFGAPAILQSDNGSEFTAQVITELKELWPQLIMVHGKPRHPQSQVSVEKANSDIKDILVAWMSDNNTQDWTVGLKFVQQQKNSAHPAGINRTPYNAMFGEDPKVGLTSSSLPPEILKAGILSKMYSRNQFDLCPQRLLNDSAVNR